MKSIWNEDDRKSLVGRIGRLGAEMRPRWGKMGPAEVLVHLADPMRNAMGEIPCAMKDTPFRRFPVKQLVVYLMPWPKGAPTAPEYLHPEARDVEGARRALREAMERFVVKGPEGAFGEHPAFGMLSGRAWGRLMWRHMDHHLRQYGL